MMWSYLIVAALCGAVCVNAVAVRSAEEDDTDVDVAQFVISRCKEAGGKALLKELVDAADTAGVCMQNKHNVTLSSMQEICAGYDEDCSAPLLEKFKTCLKPEEEDLLAAVHRVVKNVLAYICEDNYAHIEVLLEPASDTCLSNVVADSEAACLQKLNEVLAEKGIEHVFLKEGVCREVQILTGCLKDTLEVKCAELPELRTIVEKVFAIVDEECAAN